MQCIQVVNMGILLKEVFSSKISIYNSVDNVCQICHYGGRGRWINKLHCGNIVARLLFLIDIL